MVTGVISSILWGLYQNSDARFVYIFRMKSCKTTCILIILHFHFYMVQNGLEVLVFQTYPELLIWKVYSFSRKQGWKVYYFSRKITRLSVNIKINCIFFHHIKATLTHCFTWIICLLYPAHLYLAKTNILTNWLIK